jgi:hypothetical protein
MSRPALAAKGELTKLVRQGRGRPGFGLGIDVATRAAMAATSADPTWMPSARAD